MFKVGDTVEYIDSKGALTVKALLPLGKLLVTDEFGMDYSVDQHAVLKRAGGQLHFVPKRIKTEKGKATGNTEASKGKTLHYINTFKVVGKAKVSVDLHLHEILPDTVHLPPHKALDFQLKVFNDAFLKAQKARARDFLIVHGYGKGVLRAAIRDFLSNKGLEFMDADYGEYGQGATRCFMR